KAAVLSQRTYSPPVPFHLSSIKLLCNYHDLISLQLFMIQEFHFSVKGKKDIPTEAYTVPCIPPKSIRSPHPLLPVRKPEFQCEKPAAGRSRHKIFLEIRLPRDQKYHRGSLPGHISPYESRTPAAGGVSPAGSFSDSQKKTGADGSRQFF